MRRDDVTVRRTKLFTGTAFAVLTTLLAAGVAFAYSYNFNVPSFGGYSCTVSEPATGSYMTVKVEYVEGGGTLNYAGGEDCVQTSSGGSGGQILSNWYPIPDGTQTKFNDGGTAGQNIQLWVASPLDYTTYTNTYGTWEP
jgi:hypothetical protein